MSGKTPVTGPGQPLLYNGAGSPPPYGSSGHYHHHHHHHHHHGVAYVPQARSVPVAVQPPGTVVVVKERARCRLLRTVVLAIIIWLLLSAFVKSMIVLTGWGYGYGHGRPRQWTVGPGTQSPDYPIPGGINVTSCEELLRDGGPNQTTFQVPSSSSAVLLSASGPGIHGSVRVTSTSAQTDSVKFSVNLSSRHNREADTIVCSLERGNGEKGVGIFNPRHERRQPWDVIRYDVVVTFPEDHPVIKRFEASVTNSVYEIDDLRGKILFEALSLHGSNGGIYSKSFFAQWADISTSNGHIEGYYNTSDFLRLHTSNGRIDVDVDFNQASSDRAILSMTTTNAPLKAQLRLHDFIPKKATTEFDVTGTSSNAPVNIVFDDAPVDSTLALRAASSNSPAEVTLHPTFEGHFSLQSSLFTPIVHQRPRVEDPSGRGRDRVLRFGHTRGFVTGDVAWGRDPSEGKGDVNVRSSNARVTLNL